MENGKSKSVEGLRTMADALEELQLNLEPVRDKALDQKAFYTGYAQCAEQMIKVIVAKMNHLREKATQEENGELIEEEITPKEEVEMEAPLVVEPEEKPKAKRGRKKKVQEVKEA